MTSTRVRVWGALVLAAALSLGLALAPASVAHASEAEAQVQQHAAPHQAHEEGGGAHAEGGGEHAPGIDWGKLAMQFVNFGVLLFALIFFGGKAINKALLARHQQLKTDLAAAAEARATAEARLAKQEARLAALESEIAAIKVGIKHEAEAEKARLIAAAEERARRIREETSFILAQQVKEAEADLKREVAEASVKVAEEILRRSLDGRDQQRMLDTFVDEVASGDGVPGAGPEADGAVPRRPSPRSQA